MKTRSDILKGVAALMTLGALLSAIAYSSTVARAQGGPPTCDGLPCDQQWECGSKCICNPHALVCLDNTTVEQ